MVHCSIVPLPFDRPRPPLKSHEYKSQPANHGESRCYSKSVIRDFELETTTGGIVFECRFAEETNPYDDDNDEDEDQRGAGCL